MLDFHEKKCVNHTTSSCGGGVNTVTKPKPGGFYRNDVSVAV